MHSHRLVADNPAISCPFRTLRPEALRPRLAAGLRLHCEASQHWKFIENKLSATDHMSPTNDI
jgi:hypothetical protein